MLSKSQLKIWLSISLCLLFLGQSCSENSTGTSSTTTSTVKVTATSSATRTPTPIVSVTSIPDDVATLNSIQTASINTLISTVQPVVLARYPSADGKWEVDIIRYECMNYSDQDYKAIIAYEQLSLINFSDGTEKIVDDQPQTCDGIGMAGLGGLYWSPNNRYFYYTDAREG